MTANPVSEEHVADHDSNGPRKARRFGYLGWMIPTLESNDLSPARHGPSPVQNATVSAPASQRRGRGRPRVNQLRNESASEKRRAQVREAQRTYQKRKDTAAESERRRCDDVLQIMSTLSNEIEALLQAASKAGTLSQEGELSDRVRQLWSGYDTAINSPDMGPELRLLQVKNERRRAEHRGLDGFRVGLGSGTPIEAPLGPRQEQPQMDAATETDPSQMELVRVEETTLLQPLSKASSIYANMAGRSMFDIVQERQAVFNSTRSSTSS